VKVRGNCM